VTDIVGEGFRANELPVQITEGVGQLIPDVTYVVVKDFGPETFQAPANPVYFQHTPGFQTMETFTDMNVLLTQKGGRIAGVADWKMDGREMGRVKKKDGTFKSVRADEEELALKNADGVVVGTILGTSVAMGTEEDILSWEEASK
jgi:hypothetical protein